MALSLCVPVLTFPYPTPLEGLQRAIDLAATIGGEVLAPVVEVDIPPITNPFIPIGFDVAAMAAEAEASSRARAADASAHLARVSRRMNVKLDIEGIRSRSEGVGKRLAIAARTHDFSVFCLGEGGDEQNYVAESLIFDTGRPVVLIPADTDASLHLKTVAVAWDGSRASARALYDALPLFDLAERVVVLTAEREKQIDPRSIKDALAVLDRRGIEHRQVDVVLAGATAIGDALQEAAIRSDAGLLVMGGYGHNRLREFILGGATRSVLRGMRLPVLMSH